MSQHDLEIANQGFAAFRQDLNDALQALGGLQSGADAPATTYANMFWYETDTDKLYIRNEDNDAWIEVLTFDQANDHLATIGATITLDGAGNMSLAGDLTVDTDTLVVDSTNNRVGINKSAPDNPLDVYNSSAGTLAHFRSEDGTYNPRFSIYGDSAGTHLHHTWSSGASNIMFEVGGSAGSNEKMRLSSGGQVSIGTTTSSYKLYVKETGNTTANRVQNSYASLTNAAPIVQITADRSASSAYYLLETRSGGTADREHILRGDGNAFCDGSWINGGADYAEYFEWTDGNASNEDRRGYSVVLVGDKIRKATSSDTASDIIGVISGRPSVVGDAAWNKWNKKYNTDDFGSYIREAYTVTEWTEADGTEHSYASDEIPSGLVASAGATVLTTDADGATLTRRQLNASYDDSQAYTPREDRAEWDAVGLMGKLRLRVGQPTGSNWIKMRDTATDDGGNVTIEEWLVR